MKRRKSRVPIQWLAAVACCLVATISSAQTVAIQNGLGEHGFGWMFSHNGLCYAVLPRHVAGPFPRITVTTEAPVVTGTGTVDLPFWDGIDLAIAVVRGAVEGRCVGALDAMTAMRLNQVTGRLDLVRFGASGDRIRDRLVVNSTSYLTFEAELESADFSIGQGTSGAFAMVGDNPLGMAVSAPTDNSALFIRADEIHIHINRYLTQYAGSALPSSAPGAGTTEAEQGFALSLSSVDLSPINPTFAPENMLSDGQYVFEFTSTNRIVMEIDSDGPVGFRRLIVQSDPDAGYALPREILVEFSPLDSGGRFFPVGRFTMGQDGLMDTGVMGARNARRIRITIISAWSEGPVSIRRVVLQ